MQYNAHSNQQATFSNKLRKKKNQTITSITAIKVDRTAVEGN